MEGTAGEDFRATLELGDGTTRVPVFVVLCGESEGEVGEPAGYLRLAHGQGNYVNRLLGSAGHRARLVWESGRMQRIRITSTEPGEAPGYLCAFSCVS